LSRARSLSWRLFQIRCVTPTRDVVPCRALAVTASALAGSVHYDESVWGDLPESPSSFQVDIGANTISGNTHFFVLEPGCPDFYLDFDGFAFALPAHMQLVEASLSFTLDAHNVSRAESQYLLRSAD
jgi:hypothetical protein